MLTPTDTLISTWDNDNKPTAPMVKTIASFGLYFLRLKPSKNFDGFNLEIPSPMETLISIWDNE